MRPVFAFFILSLVSASAAEAPLRALLVCGGCCHDYEKQSVILRDGIQARANVQVDVVISPDKKTSPWFPMYEKKDWAKGYDVVIHDECSADIKDMSYVSNIVDAHKAGLAAVNLHCAMHSYRTGTDVWFEFLGLQSSGHGAQKPISIDFSGADHEITRGLAGWTTGNEELYNNVKVFPTAKPLALGKQDQGDGKSEDAVVVWTNDYHGSRVFNTTIGHNNETVADDRYLDLVVRGLLWSCGKLTPDYEKAYTGPAGKFEKVAVRQQEERRQGRWPRPPENATLVTATASSAQDRLRSWLAIDGSEDSRWCAESGAFPQWYQMEFEKEVPLTGIDIIWESENNAYRHKIEGSADGKEWTLLTDATKQEKGGATSSEFPKAAVKFVKITCTGTSQGGWASIRQISAKGEGIGPLFPKPRERRRDRPNDPYQKSGNTTPGISSLTPEQVGEVLKDVKVADGFDVSLFATPAEANYPVYVASAPGGDLYVASDGNGSLGTDPQRGRVVRLRDKDNDGRADEVTEFVKELDSPRGMVWDHDRLYVVHPPDVSCFIDRDGDGVAEERKTLITGVAFGFKDRTADHTTNGLSLGIDGWLYISGGDFGIKDAVGSDGRRLQHRAGGVIRFRPDGSGMELFSTGTRNILGTPISPLLDIFARDNTNDGGGWDVRFHHFTGLEDHGYPRMYINFADEIVKPLADYGGGSGCGSVYVSEPGIPAKWNNSPLTCDWGTNGLWRHKVEPSGATFKETEKPEALIQMTRPTDADVDGMSRIYQASWKGATFKWEGPQVGYIVRVSPKGYTPEPLPDFEKASDAELIRLLESPSQVRTLEAQRALLRRPASEATTQELLALAKDVEKTLPARVAALYAISQRATSSAAATPVLALVSPLASDPALGRFVLRAMGDAGLDGFASGKTTAPAGPFIEGLKKSNDPRTRLEAIVGATRQNMQGLAPQIADLAGDPDPVVAHTAFRSLAMLKAADACFAVVDNASSPPAQRTGALRALMRMHLPEVVQGLISRLEETKTPAARAELLSVLARLHFHEGEWKGDSWGTRPDTRGPYYQPEAWSETPKIAAVLKAELENASPADAPAFIRELRRNRIEFNEALERITALVKQKPELLPDLVEQLASVENLPADGIPYLISATKGDWPARTIAQAVATLAKTDSKEGCIASLGAIANLSDMKDADRPRDGARNAFLSSQKLENHHQLLEEQAEKLDGEVSVWADAALLALSGRKEGSPEARELSQKALEHGWEDGKRRIQILKAIKATGFHGFDDKVREAMEDSDADVATIAKATGESLKLEKKGEDKTPLVSTLKPDEVVAEVMKTKGSVSLGEQMFSRCVACHAVSLDEPQKGPFLGNIAQTYSREELAANILDPGKTIAQGFATELFILKDGTSQAGFVTLESSDQVKVRNIQAQEFSWKTSDIEKREKLPISLMPPGLANDMTIRGFASLLDYLESLSKK